MSPSNHLSVEDAGHGQGHGYGHVNEHGRRHSESRNAPSPVGTINSNVYAKENPAASAGYFSPLTKVYIGDVLDHLELIISSMDQFVASCDHLTDYVFVSYVSRVRFSLPSRRTSCGGVFDGVGCWETGPRYPHGVRAVVRCPCSGGMLRNASHLPSAMHEL